jgi:DNA polymerase V
VQPRAGVLNLSKATDVLPYLTQTPIEDIWGIGRQTAPKLTSKGINTAADYIQTPIGTIQQILNLPGEQIWYELQGRDRLGFQERSTTTKSLIVSRSFGKPITDFKSTQQAISSFAETVARKLRLQKQQTDRLTVSLGWRVQSGTRYKPTTSATVTLDQPTNLAAPLITAALQALQQAWLHEFPVVKAGIAVSALSSEAQTALSLFFDDSAQTKQNKLQQTWKKIDSLNQKYGHGLIMAGSSLKANGHVDWQSQRNFGSPRYVSNWNELAQVK